MLLFNKLIFAILISFSCVQVHAATIPEAELEEVTEKANEGNPESQYRLGKHYMLSWSENFDKTNNYFKKGTILLKAYLKDRKQAIHWLERAAKQEHFRAQYDLGVLHYSLKNYREALFWFAKSTLDGDVMAQYHIAIITYNGAGAIDLPDYNDYKNAAYWFERMALEGYPEAQYDLAAMQYNGQGVEQDKEGAIKLLKKAASQNHISSQGVLASIYFTEKEYRNSYVWGAIHHSRTNQEGEYPFDDKLLSSHEKTEAQATVERLLGEIPSEKLPEMPSYTLNRPSDETKETKENIIGICQKLFSK